MQIIYVKSLIDIVDRHGCLIECTEKHRPIIYDIQDPIPYPGGQTYAPDFDNSHIHMYDFIRSEWIVPGTQQEELLS